MKNKILIIDDCVDIRELVEEILNKKGYDTISLGSVEDALNLIKNYVPDLILVDYQMEPMSGEDFVFILEKEYPLMAQNVPIIMLTANENDFMPKCRVSEVVQKTSGSQAFISAVEKHLNYSLS